ncbi:hypothetical protein [Streptomyces sp. ISL-94]|uniref:hypothetical protein n=1 Tax=Streptomyces sp. ISL-94 TaxID=2819190 RepID=UPI001BEB6C8C|nr:hypothetical protein [Streptomyces sp. ISL-94]MBT2476841.1 hypothetical protein [Streptomyces sp. ISL-94]
MNASPNADPTQPSAPRATGCCATSAPQDSAAQPCCGTSAAAEEAGSCCAPAAKAEAVTAGSSCC